MKTKLEITQLLLKGVPLLVTFLWLSACRPPHQIEVDKLNDKSYAFHYRDLDSTKKYALQALELSDDYGQGYAEACNNLAFVDIMHMDYAGAYKLLAKVSTHTDDQIELLVADIQQMRLCQRESRNKDFYDFRERAARRLKRIDEEGDNLSRRQKLRMVYARSEFGIVNSTYLYYVGLEKPFIEALESINPVEVEQDTAQYLNYLYCIGAGGAIQGTREEVAQTEFNYLLRCYLLADGSNYPFWKANSMQAISEHLQSDVIRRYLIKNNQSAIKFINVDQMNDSLLAGNLAQRSLELFMKYGDVYQTAGAYRTLAQCYWCINDYKSAAICLETALTKNKAINEAPDLVASIREQLSLVYSAIDDKPNSDRNRNLYLDLQEQTRQDRQLEARAAQLDKNAAQLNWMIIAVITMIVFVIALLIAFGIMRRRNNKRFSYDKLLDPLNVWKEHNEQEVNSLLERQAEIEEKQNIVKQHIDENKRRNLEQRAKVQLVNSITPLIDRIVHEVAKLSTQQETAVIRKERFDYISEVADKISEYNDVLTHWIQMRQGALSLHIESFPLQLLFNVVKKGKMSFLLKGITLKIGDTQAVVKADRTLTLFMVNTIADNARKFTGSGGEVHIYAQETDEYVEIRIEDTGKGMDGEQLSHIFDHTYTGGHGFGLLNCKGIIEKYKKISTLFKVCEIGVESTKGKGSKFFFRLPKGLVRGLRLFLVMVSMAVGLSSAMASGESVHHGVENMPQSLVLAGRYADSAYFSNINGRYRRTLEFADSARKYLNAYYLEKHPEGKFLMKAYATSGEPAEIRWFHDGLVTRYSVILDIRNESAVAALALHEWQLYIYNNKVYTQLFRERSADDTLDNYVRTMQASENSKMVAIILLIVLLVLIFPAYYLLYYRHVVAYKLAVEQVNTINAILLTEQSDEDKLKNIRQIWQEKPILRVSPRLHDVVRQIKKALEKSVAYHQNQEVSIELAEDELHRSEYENDKLYISNSVLDNCLSALKHETMYYPSRIRQLIDDNPENVEALSELVGYYKSLYTMLSEQAMQQVVGNVKLDKAIVEYLFDMLRKESGGNKLELLKSEKDSLYVIYMVKIPHLRNDEEYLHRLFTPLTDNLNFLLCRQIVREIGEVFNMRRCGIRAFKDEHGLGVIEIVLPKSLENVIGK